MSGRPIKISVYAYETASAPLPLRRGGLSATATRAMRGTIVAIFCLISHGLLFTTFMWSAAPARTSSPKYPARVNVASEDDPDALQWVALDPEALTDPLRPKLDASTVHLQPIDVRKALAQVALLVPDLDLPATPDATVADAGRLSKMYGRYVGQVSARIDRTWLRPRTAIGAPGFSCQVRLIQDVTGHIMEIMLEQCNGDSRWQLSLVQAIQSASPLPAPPDPDVFSRTLHLAFTGEAYSAQQSADQYEPEATAREVQALNDARAAENALTHLDEARGPVAVTLTIKGDHKTFEFHNISDAARNPDTTAPH